jgi:hypothetical protein
MFFLNHPSNTRSLSDKNFFTERTLKTIKKFFSQSKINDMFFLNHPSNTRWLSDKKLFGERTLNGL